MLSGRGHLGFGCPKSPGICAVPGTGGICDWAPAGGVFTVSGVDGSFASTERAGLALRPLPRHGLRGGCAAALRGRRGQCGEIQPRWPSSHTCLPTLANLPFVASNMPQ